MQTMKGDILYPVFSLASGFLNEGHQYKGGLS